MQLHRIILGPLEPAVRHAYFRMRNWWFANDYSLPTIITFEISSSCNRRCHYCPQGNTPRKGKNQIVDDGLWHKFLSELHELNYAGQVGLAMHNEPGLVPDFVKRIRQVKAYAPHALVILFSNGDFYKEIESWVNAGVTRIFITEHPPMRQEWRDRIMPIAKKYPSIVLVSQLPVESIHDHAGNAGNKVFKTDWKACPQASPTMLLGVTIQHTGKAVVCCWDYHGEVVVGDLRTQTMKQIWESHKFVGLRKLLAQGYAPTPLCERCLHR